MNESINKLAGKITDLEVEIKNFRNAIIYAEKDKCGIGIGTDYARNKYPHDDPDLAIFIESKIKKAKEKLEPLLKRMSIIEELAAETINSKKGQ